MRRSFLFASIAAGAIALFTTGSVVVATNRATKIETFKSKLADLTFCRTAFEIASSHPSYITRFIDDEKTKEELIEESDALDSKKAQIDILIIEHIEEARDLPLDESERVALIEKVTWDAELEAVQAAGWVEKPEAFLDHINEICEPYLS